jgi:hypothetical protein
VVNMYEAETEPPIPFAEVHSANLAYTSVVRDASRACLWRTLVSIYHDPFLRLQPFLTSNCRTRLSKGLAESMAPLPLTARRKA